MAKKRRSIHEITAENDMKYRGPLSYRHMRIIGWVAMICAQIAIVCSFCVKSWANAGHDVGAISVTQNVFSFIGYLAVPLFLLANFAIILTSRKDIKRLLILHLGLSLLIYVIFLIIYERYLIGIFSKMFPDDGRAIVEIVVRTFLSQFLSFNVFVDLLMCSLTYFFITYTPEKFFTGKKIYIFRSLVALPILYEIGCILIRGLSIAEGLFTIPIEILPLLTTKPPLTFLVFLVIVIFLKYREKLFMKRTNGDEERYNEFIQTNTNSWHFSVTIAILFAIVVVIDIAAYVIFLLCNIERFVGLADGNFDVGIELLNTYAGTWGFGKTIPLIITIPFVLLFSYTKKHTKKSKILDMLIPAAGILLCLITYIEGYYEIIVFK